MNITLGMLFQVDHKRISIAHGCGEIVVQLRVVHEQSERAFLAVQLGRQLLYVVESGVYFRHCFGNVDSAKVLRELVGVVKHIVSLGKHSGNVLVELCRKAVYLRRGGGKVVGNGVNVVQRIG